MRTMPNLFGFSSDKRRRRRQHRRAARELLSPSMGADNWLPPALQADIDKMPPALNRSVRLTLARLHRQTARYLGR